MFCATVNSRRSPGNSLETPAATDPTDGSHDPHDDALGRLVRMRLALASDDRNGFIADARMKKVDNDQTDVLLSGPRDSTRGSRSTEPRSKVVQPDIVYELLNLPTYYTDVSSFAPDTFPNLDQQRKESGRYWRQLRLI